MSDAFITTIAIEASDGKLAFTLGKNRNILHTDTPSEMSQRAIQFFSSTCCALGTALTQ